MFGNNQIKRILKATNLIIQGRTVNPRMVGRLSETVEPVLGKLVTVVFGA